MHNASAASAAQPTSNGHDTPDFDLVQRAVAELEEAVREQAGHDKRLSRFLLCRNDGLGERIVLDARDCQELRVWGP